MAHETKGLYGTSDDPSTAVIRAVAGRFVEEEADIANFTVALLRAQRQARFRPMFNVNGLTIEWHDREARSRSLTVGSTAPGTGTTIIVLDTAQTQHGTMLQFNGQEDIFVDSVNDTTLTLTVFRDFSATGVTQSIPAGADLRILSRKVAEEGDLAGDAFARDPVAFENFVETFEESVALTTDEIRRDLYTYPKVTSKFEERINDATRRLMEHIEETILKKLGGATVAAGGTGSNDFPLRHMKGLPAFITTNQFGINGAFTPSDARRVTLAAIRFGGPNRRSWLGGQIAQSALSVFGEETIRTTQSESTFSRGISRVNFMGFSADFMPSLSLEGPSWRNAMYVLNFPDIQLYEFEGLTIDRNAQLPGSQRRQAVLRMKLSLAVRAEKRHALVRGIEF